MNPIKCIYIVQTGTALAKLRRSRWSDKTEIICSTNERGWNSHDVEVEVGEVPITFDAKGTVEGIPWTTYKDDPRWPTHCSCGYEFTTSDDRDVDLTPLYREEGKPNGPLYALNSGPLKAPVGSIWAAPWYKEVWHGDDGECYVCRIPSASGSHDWIIDSKCNNCTEECGRCHKRYGECTCKYPDGFMPTMPHQCWVRHGTPPNLTVDKRGITCRAGAGSIIVDGWHGFLTNGELRSC